MGKPAADRGWLKRKRALELRRGHRDPPQTASGPNQHVGQLANLGCNLGNRRIALDDPPAVLAYEPDLFEWYTVGYLNHDQSVITPNPLFDRLDVP